MAGMYSSWQPKQGCLYNVASSAVFPGLYGHKVHTSSCPLLIIPILLQYVQVHRFHGKARNSQ